MLIKWADFKASYTAVEQVPAGNEKEFAFIGRSNVGKSSLINYLVDRKGLVKVSGTPGKTQLLNYFLINKQFYFVDLPGYGYARVPKGIRQKFGKMIEDYICRRPNLMCTCMLVDSRIEPQEIDIAFAQQLQAWSRPFVLVYTKAEKMSRHELNRHKLIFCNQAGLGRDTPVFITSASHKQGKDELLTYFDTILTIPTSFHD
jgi:GTP-binding protein